MKKKLGCLIITITIGLGGSVLPGSVAKATEIYQKPNLEVEGYYLENERGATSTYWELDTIISKKLISKTYLGTVTKTTTVAINGTIPVYGGIAINGGVTHSSSKQFKQYRYVTRYTIRYKKVTAMGNFLGYETVTSNSTHIVYEPI